MIKATMLGLSGLTSALVLAIGITAVVPTPPAHAAECTTEKKRDELSPAEAQELYNCIEGKLLEGYTKASDVPGVSEYRSWPLVTNAPLVSSTHGGQFVNHWVSPGAVDLYTKYENMNGGKFEVGSILAKESFRVTKKGEVKRGPLFLMEKVADSEAPGGWIYTRLFPNGKYQRTNSTKADKVSFCHDCHEAVLEDQDASFFPPEEYRAEVK